MKSIKTSHIEIYKLEHSYAEARLATTSSDPTALAKGLDI